MKITNYIKSFIASLNRKQTIVFSFSLILIIIYLIFLIINKGNKEETLQGSAGQETEKITQEVKPAEFTQEQLEKYYETYEDPYVKHIRVALNGYLDGTMEGIGSVDTVVKEKTNADGSVSGLDAYSKDYYKSKFVVVLSSPSVAGGKEINIIFQDKPDKIFWTWVYAKESDVYELRGFSENIGIQGDKLRDTLIIYKNVIEDKEHSL